jgi:hypothetical protein
MLFAGDGSPVYMVQAPKLLADRGTTNVSALTVPHCETASGECHTGFAVRKESR